MKQFTFICVFNLALTGVLAGGNTPSTAKSQPSIAFTENKGQVYDQHYRPRPDVLFGAMAGELSLHIKRNGVSYQLYRVDRLKEVSNPNGETHQEIDQQTINRIDLSWLNCNSDFFVVHDEPLPGYTNYFIESCPKGALNVKSYKGVTLNNIYHGINLHYYEKDGELKHDYIIAAHADFTKIQIHVAGANTVLREDGSLVFETPLGTVQEGAPVVFQNGKQLRASWVVKNNVLSFAVEGVDPTSELIIDPVTRIWGTYYGGTSVFNGTDYGYGCATDANDNVYLVGHSVATGTIIATSGVHQSSIAGSDDAFLVKFNSNGVRLWGTYFGGTGTETGVSCAVDPSFNVYVTGLTASKTAGSISTGGVHQPSHAGGANYDGYLVKFNSNGLRVWGTYIGGTSSDFPQSCAFDINGGVYIAGVTDYSSSGFSSPGAHQPAHGGGSFEGFLVKFNPVNGTRLWGTYYGGASDDRVISCATDPSGNVYISGYSGTTAPNIIATPSSHQPVASGNSGAFLAKFNSSGTRLWATYYGGAGDFGFDCKTDAAGNVYLAGRTSSATAATTLIATPGTYQTAPDGVADAFVAKFNSNGVRQWGTYYGGNDHDAALSCAVDVSGNVYIGGYAMSTNSAAIASPGSHQTAFAGGTVDCFVAKLDATGNRIAGSYFGGAGYEYGGLVAISKTGHAYLSGYTGSSAGTEIATPNGHQPVFGGTPFDAFLAKFDLCNGAPLLPAINGATFGCAGVPMTYSTPLVSGVHSLTFGIPGGWSSTGSGYSVAVTPVSSAVFSLSAENTCGITTQTLNVPVYQNPTVTVNSGTICSGKSFSLQASGAVSYTYSGGVVVSPQATTVYTVTGISSEGCFGKAVTTITVFQTPVITAPNVAICAGESHTITPTGATTYTYSNGQIVTPPANSSYTVYGTGVAGCTNHAVVNVTVNPLPTFTPVSSHSLLCAGEAATLSAGGVSLNVGTDGGIIMPGETTTYTVSGTDANGCTSTAIITQSVDACTGIGAIVISTLKIFPNPASQYLFIEVNGEVEVSLINALGQVVMMSRLNGNSVLNLTTLPQGVYFLKAGSSDKQESFRIVRE